MLVFSPTITSILYASRLVSPVLVNTSPMTTDAKINMTDGSIKSVKATFAGRIKKRACNTPIARLVIPMGTTSKTHQVPASRNIAKAPFPSRVKVKRSPIGSTASAHGGE